MRHYGKCLARSFECVSELFYMFLESYIKLHKIVFIVFLIW